MNTKDRAKTPLEKAFKAAMRKIGWHVHRHEESGRLVTNLYRNEVEGLSKRLGIPLEVIPCSGSLVRASPAEPIALTD
jgi:hypothetical protein